MTCPQCGSANPERAKFCLECGTALAGAPAARAREERKVVSVLFADLVGFTSQAERMDPEEVRAVLGPYHASLRSSLEQYGGTVEKFIGDAVMALFGAPVAHEDDPERAVRAALAIRDTLAADGRLHVRIGITTGEALVALDARPESGEGMAAGDVVNTAARLQAAAPIDGILVDEVTYRATARTIHYRDHDPVTVKGKSDAIPVREVVSARARFGVDVRQTGQAPLVGRTPELDMLSGALERAITEREPQLVTLIGVPGIGKSRVVWELFGRVDRGDRLVAWRQGRSLPYAEGISFWALGEIVKAESGILDTDTREEAAAKLAATVAATLEGDGGDTDAAWIERHLRLLVGLEPDTNDVHGDRRGESFAAWTRYLEALAHRRPLVLVFEDLHWADDGLLDFVDHLLDWATGVPMLIVGTTRPELLTRRPGWGGGKPNALTISLSPLSEAETSRLVGELIERAVIPVALRDAVLERAQGNPLYAEEFARLVAERGHFDELPESVQGIIAARLDALVRDDKELIQDASVVGKVFWSGAVADMRGRARPDAEQQLHGLERKEFVRRERRSSVAAETEYAFRHILVRDVAYGQIPRGDRAERHARAAAWIQSLGRATDHAELIAQHYLAAIDLARAAGRSTDAYAALAAPALREAGDRASALNAFASAARYYRAALELMSRDDEQRAAVLFRYGKALRISEERGAAELAEAEAALRAAGDLATAAEAAVLQAELSWFAGDGAATTKHLERAAALVDNLPASASKGYVLSDLSRFHMLAGRDERAIAVGRQALQIADSLDLDEIRAHALNNVGIARVNEGDPDGLGELETALEIATRIKSPEAARVMNNLASGLIGRGETMRARQLWRDGLVWARQLGNRSVERFISWIVPYVDYAEGKWDPAIAALDELIAESEATGGHVQEADARADRARIRFARGDVDGAVEDGERAIVRGRRVGDPQSVLPPLALMGTLMFALDRREEGRAYMDELLGAPQAHEWIAAESCLAIIGLGRRAELTRVVHEMPETPWKDICEHILAGSFGDAVAGYERMGVLPGAAVLRLEAARALAVEGRTEEAREHLARATEFWRSVGATHYLAEADALERRLNAASGAPAGDS